MQRALSPSALIPRGFDVESAICDGNTSGEYRMHMVAARKIAMSQKLKNPEFQSLFDEFFYYHWIASEITYLDGTEVPMMENFSLPFSINPETAGLIGVSDGLFGFISKISNLRRKLRTRIDEKIEPIMDYEALLTAHAIDTGLRNRGPGAAGLRPRPARHLLRRTGPPGGRRPGCAVAGRHLGVQPRGG